MLLLVKLLRYLDMKNNFIAKNLNKVNKPSVHIDRKKEPIDKHKDINSRMKDVKYDRLA